MFRGQVERDNLEFKRGKDKQKRKRRGSGLRRKADILRRKLAVKGSRFKENVSGRARNLTRGAIGSVKLRAGKVNRAIQDRRNKIAAFYVENGEAEMKAGGYAGLPELTKSGIVKKELGKIIGTKAKRSEVLGKSSRKRKPGVTNYGYLPGELEQITTKKRIIS